MLRVFGPDDYVTNYVVDHVDGYVGLELLKRSNGKEQLVAKILFWDAVGQFFVETFNEDVPLEVLEEMIREVKQKIRMT